MSLTSHLTVRLTRGQHSGPDQGMCVMELASMLAGERFTDRPDSVCPIVAGFLRAYNDGVDDERRQDLYRSASLAVGTRGSARIELERAAMCLDWAKARQAELQRGLRRFLPRPPLVSDGLLLGDTIGSVAGTMSAKVVARSGSEAHDAALRFIERLVTKAERPAPEPAIDLAIR